MMSETNPLRISKNELEGCMVGRLALETPWQIAQVDSKLFNECVELRPSREETIMAYAEYCEREQLFRKKEFDQAVSKHILIKPLQNLFKGEWAGREWRRMLQTRLL